MKIAANTTPIAERTLLCRPAGEAERLVQLCLYAPVEDDGGWLCEAALLNLFRDRARARGVDSLQALQLALGALHEALEGVIRGGGTVSWADGSPFTSLDDIRS
ncbi:MAG: hypothetical protein JJT88_19420 [Gammaproteobacteria bacterium]|nr:hypothetical protein [Gammaproteobacteria bacterium]